MKYRLTHADIDRYLADKQDHEVIGYCQSPHCCLLANVAKAKYPDVGVGVYHNVIRFFGWPVGLSDSLPLTAYQKNIQKVFDTYTSACYLGPVTKADFLAAWQRAEQNRLAAAAILTLAEVACILRVHPNTVRAWTKQGVLASVTLPHTGTRQVRRVMRETLEILLSGTAEQKKKSGSLICS
jgi:hypothetical protein